jgi:hypothetical protein
MIRNFMLLTAVIGLTLGTAGCKGGEKKDGDKEGKQGAASSKSNHDKLQGEWGIDVDKMIELDPKAQEQLKANPGMKDMMVKMMGSAKFTITKDSLTASLMGKDEKATYTVKSQEGNKVVIETTEKADDDKEKVEIITATFVNDNLVILTKDGDDEKIPLKRK